MGMTYIKFSLLSNDTRQLRQLLTISGLVVNGGNYGGNQGIERCERY